MEKTNKINEFAHHSGNERMGFDKRVKENLTGRLSHEKND